MILDADWLSTAGALWYSGQSLLLLALAYFLGCLFGCWFRRIQPQPDEAMATAPAVAPPPAPEPKPAPVASRTPVQASSGRLRGAFEESGRPQSASAPARPEAPLTMGAIRTALAEKPMAIAPTALAVPIVPVTPAVDDLKRIKGIGPEIERKLNGLDITRYQDIVRWTASDVDRVGQAIGAEARITHENWIEQAAILAAGGETAFSRRVDRKEVLASPRDTWVAIAPAQVERQGMVTAEAKPRDPTSDPRKAATAVAASAEEIGRRREAPVVPGAMARSSTGGGASAAEAVATTAGKITLKPAGPVSPIVKPTPTSQAAQPVASRSSVARPSSMKPEPDDLKRIRGITPEIERQLNALGVNRFAQIAGWAPQAVEKASNVLNVGSRITQENWVEQAMILARGGETEYSRRQKLGTVPIATPPAVAAPSAAVHHDDLKRIRGISIVLETKLNAMGVRTYADIAHWSPGDAARFAQALDIPGRIERENWICQAQVLASGQATEFSNRVDRGEVEPSKV
jgi:predicted flap endonuclease-1-like 5' DNA nuclease